MNQSQPIFKDLVLLGGGHSHAIALRMFGMKPMPGVRLTLLTEASDTAYSGMLPGHVAGFYSRDECHINLRRLAQFAGAQVYVDCAIGLDLVQKRILCASRPPVGFDLLSINLGSTPKLPDVVGDREAIIPAKPVRHFLERWDQVVHDITRSPEKVRTIGIVGGGAGGVELALTMQQHLQRILSAAQQPLTHLVVHLFQKEVALLPTQTRWVRDRFQTLLTQRGIQLHVQETVCTVQPHRLTCASGLTVDCDYIFWVTQASAPDWLAKAGLTVDADGFVLVDDTLRSLSHPDVFAAGDSATMINYPRPKAGVFAVRQGKPLVNNLRRTVQNKPLKPFRPQTHYLSLIGTGDGSAIAVRGSFGWQSTLLWRWKDRIDRAFMQRFSDLPQMEERSQKSEVRLRRELRRERSAERSQKSDVKVVDSTGEAGANNFRSSQKQLAMATFSPPLSDTSTQTLDAQRTVDAHLTQQASSMRCAGCGAKVGSRILERVLKRVQQEHVSPFKREDILIGLEAPDDAAVVQVPPGLVLVQTIDYFPALLADPFVFGQISANHALSDLFAMGAQPQSALAIATIPYAQPANVEETLYQLLAGAMSVLHQAQAALIGGHTTEGAELAFGLSCNGLAQPDRLLRKGGMKPGQALILTKAIGTGTLFAAHMQLQAKGRWLDGAIASMQQSNQQAATCLLEHHATACTDVTGFGLMGHLVEMVQASNVAVTLNLAAIPLLDGALETVEQGITSSLQPQNLYALQAIANASAANTHPYFPLLFDPQTSGGLLAAMPIEHSDRCLAALQALGYHHSTVIGHTTPLSEQAKPITIA